ncbi:hypothetical protein ACFL14_01030 [Patescibacteria group bacterium]
MNKLINKPITNNESPVIIYRGYVALVTVMIIGAVGVAVVVAAILGSLASSKSSLLSEQSKQASGLADACSEHALIKLKSDINYIGDEIINLTGGNCQILEIPNPGNTDRIIQTAGTIDNITRKVKINIDQINPDLIISNWQEVEDF